MLPKFEAILYATDLSPRAPEVFRYAMSLAQRYGAKIVVVHALEPLNPMGKSLLDLYVSKETNEELHEQAREQMAAEIRERLETFCTEELCADPEGRGRVSEIVVRDGHPLDVILKEVARTGAGLVVMGSHGHTAVGEILLGSTAHRVMQRSPVPVFLVRYQKKG